MSIVACELDSFRLTNFPPEREESCGSRTGAASAWDPPNSSKHDLRIFSPHQTAGPPAGLCTKPRLGGRRSPIQWRTKCRAVRRPSSPHPDHQGAPCSFQISRLLDHFSASPEPQVHFDTGNEAVVARFAWSGGSVVKSIGRPQIVSGGAAPPPTRDAISTAPSQIHEISTKSEKCLGSSEIWTRSGIFKQS